MPQLDELGQIIDGRQSETALRVQRGTMRLLRERFDFSCFAEVSLATGRRADLLGVGPKGEIWIVEIKSSLQDYQVDKKWPEYHDYCDKFFFAKPPELDAAIFPEDQGLIVADGHGADIMRHALEDKLSAARRKALMLRVARMGADRIHQLMDPGPAAG